MSKRKLIFLADVIRPLSRGYTPRFDGWFSISSFGKKSLTWVMAQDIPAFSKGYKLLGEIWTMQSRGDL